LISIRTLFISVVYLQNLIIKYIKVAAYVLKQNFWIGIQKVLHTFRQL